MGKYINPFSGDMRLIFLQLPYFKKEAEECADNFGVPLVLFLARAKKIVKSWRFCAERDNFSRISKCRRRVTDSVTQVLEFFISAARLLKMKRGTRYDVRHSFYFLPAQKRW